MTEIQFIVDRLNEEPFNYGLNMVSFNEKPPTALIQLLSDVCAYVAEHAATDVSMESPDNWTPRLMEFLRIVKYQGAADQLTMRQGLYNGDTDVVYPVLKWVLPQVEGLKKRAFVGYYLSKVQVPEELLHDGDAQELQSAIEAMQAEFIAVHKELEAMRETSAQPATLQRRLAQLEEERDQLGSKIQSTKAKVNGKVSGPRLEQLTELSSALRREREREVELQSTLRKERERLVLAEEKYHKTRARMQTLQATSKDGSAAAALAQVTHEAAAHRERLHTTLPAEIRRKQLKLNALQKVLADPVTSEADLARLDQQRIRLDTDTKILHEKVHSKAGDQGDLQMRQQLGAAKSVAKKKEDVLYKLDKLTDKRNVLRGNAGESDGGGGGGMATGDMRGKYEAVKGKLVTYKNLKKELDEIQNEVLVLSRTQAVLEEKAGVVAQAVSEEEKSKGVAGFAHTAQTLEHVSNQKGQIDEAKGATLEKISSLVTEINQTIKERKGALAPQIKELRTVRQRFQDVEGEHTEKKKGYDAAALQYSASHAKLDSEVKELAAAVLGDESQFHLTHARAQLTDATIKRVTAGLDAHALRDRYTQRVAAQEEFALNLKKKQLALKDVTSEATSADQMGMLRDLQRLLETKISVHRRGNTGRIMGGVDDGAKAFATASGANVMTF